MQTSYRAIMTFVNAAQSWLEKHPEQGKFRYAVSKVVKQGMMHWAKYTEQIEDFDIEYCSVDKDQNILKDDKGQLSFTKDGLRKRNAARKALFEADTVEITPYLSPHVPEDLTEAERQAFAGFVLPEAIEDEEDVMDGPLEVKSGRETLSPRINRDAP